MKPGKPVERRRFRRVLKPVLERRREVDSSGSPSPRAGGGRVVLTRRSGLGEGVTDFVSESSSSPQISSASVRRTVFRRGRVAPRTVSILVVGVMGSPFRRAWFSEVMAASSSALKESEYSSLSVSSTKPRPGVSADCATAGWLCSSERRQERAKTPVRRMMVPRAIRHACRAERRSAWLK